MWSPGQTITVRNVRDGMVTHASAAIVVEDRPDRLAIYMPLGTGMRYSDVNWTAGTRSAPYAQRRHTTDAVAIYTPGAGHSVTAMYRGGGGPFLCWYVDMMDPIRRVADGIVICDQQLDIVIAQVVLEGRGSCCAERGVGLDDTGIRPVAASRRRSGGRAPRPQRSPLQRAVARLARRSRVVCPRSG